MDSGDEAARSEANVPAPSSSPPAGTPSSGPTLSELQAEHNPAPRKRKTPTTELEEASPVRNYIRDLVLGLNDGIVSVYALVAGIAGAGLSTKDIGFAGVAAALAGALSMGLGEYISTKSQSQYYHAEAKLELEHIRTYPELERKELREMLEEKGYPPELVEGLHKHISSDDKRFVDYMMREEFGVGEESDRSPWAAMGLIMVAFTIGAAFAVVPFFVGVNQPLALATAASLGGLFLGGALKGRASRINWLRSGLEMAVLGAIAAVVTYGVGRWIGVSF